MSRSDAFAKHIVEKNGLDTSNCQGQPMCTVVLSCAQCSLNQQSLRALSEGFHYARAVLTSPEAMTHGY